MLKKSLAILAAATLASTIAMQPAAAQYRPGDDRYEDRYNTSDRYDDRYDARDRYDAPRPQPAQSAAQAQYERDLAQYERDSQAWRERYGHNYRTDQDSYYRDCGEQRAGNQTGGLIIGALLGAAVGSTVARGPSRGGGTALGAVLGGLAGASVGGSLDCEDQSHAYRTYYDGFERGRPNSRYEWRNRRSGNYGHMQVGDYYRDRDGFRCATYSQTIYVRGRPETAQGHACRQRDGNWAIID